MRASSVLGVVASILATVAQASPLTSSSNLKEVRAVPVENGRIVFYGVESELKEAAAAAERRQSCGANIVACDTRHEAYVNTCNQLGAYMNDNPEALVGSTERSICKELDENNKCCVSWANGATFRIKELSPAFDASRRCDGSAHANLVSARA
jgi:hypothetical protein